MKVNSKALTNEFKELLERFSDGEGTIYALCKKMKINRSSFYRRMETDEALEKSYNDACKLFYSALKDMSLQKVILGDRGWQSGAWYLERKHPSEYGTSNIEVNEAKDFTINYIQRPE